MTGGGLHLALAEGPDGHRQALIQREGLGRVGAYSEFGIVDNLTLQTVSAMREAMDWPGCLFEEKWRAGSG